MAMDELDIEHEELTADLFYDRALFSQIEMRYAYWLSRVRDIPAKWDRDSRAAGALIAAMAP